MSDSAMGASEQRLNSANYVAQHHLTNGHDPHLMKVFLSAPRCAFLLNSFRLLLCLYEVNSYATERVSFFFCLQVKNRLY